MATDTVLRLTFENEDDGKTRNINIKYADPNVTSEHAKALGGVFSTKTIFPVVYGTMTSAEVITTTTTTL